MIHAVVGLGEVGAALFGVLARCHPTYGKDLGGWVQGKDRSPSEPPGKVGVMHVALNYHAMGDAKFKEVVSQYRDTLRPKFMDICSTVAPGTTESFGASAVHSTTRGLHPNLTEGLYAVTKHVGGPRAEQVAAEYRLADVPVITHGKARTTELAHILNNSAYGVSLMFADEMNDLCRAYGVDYFEAVMLYTATHNEGFRRLDHPRLVRPVLTPPGGRLGGHCVRQGATLIPADKRGELLSRLAKYGKELSEAALGLAAATKEANGSDVPEVRQDGDALRVDPERAAAGGEDDGGEGRGAGASGVRG